MTTLFSQAIQLGLVREAWRLQCNFVCLVLCLLSGDYRGRMLRRSPPRLRESSLGITGWLSMLPLSKLAFPNMPFMTNACKDLASSRKYPSRMQA